MSGCLLAAVFALPAAAAAKSRVVYAGGPVAWSNSLQKHYGASVDNFLINRVAINVGDTVVWNGASLAGGFHTVDIPKLNGSDLPFFTATGQTVNGVDDAAGNPFWFDGKVPVLGLNTKLFARSGPAVYNGTSRVDSGLPLGPKPHNFAVKFTTPGVYKFYCDVHAGMLGYVVVKAKGKPVPSAAQDAAELQAEERHYATEARTVAGTKVPRDQVSLGASGAGGLEVFAMFPATLRVKKGTTVRFSVSKDSREAHTASFGPAPYLKQLSDSFKGPAPAADALYPSDPFGHIVLTPTSHGNGFASTGPLDRDSSTPLPSGAGITFTHPGTYHFICLIHPFMHGTIVVK